jgi:hypothetical protein
MATGRVSLGWWLWTVLGLISTAWIALIVIGSVHARSLGFDFDVNVWRPAGAILHGRNLYPSHPAADIPRTVSVNPPLLPLIASPLRLLGYSVALGVFDALNFFAFGGALWLMGVRDWRVFAIACSSAPVLSGMIFGQVAGLLALGYALAWRYRDQARVAGPVLGLMVALKLLAWPLVLWLLITRRARSALAAVTVAIVLLLVSWAVIGFDGLVGFPRLLRLAGASWAASTYSLESLGIAGGLSHFTAGLLGVVAGALLCAWMVLAARKGDDQVSFVAAAAAGIYLSPIVHLHYAAWLIVFVALVRPRVGGIWLLVVAFWLSPTQPARADWQLVVEIVLALGLAAYAIIPRSLGAAGLEAAPMG